MPLFENYAKQRNDDLMKDNLTLDPKRHMKDALSLSQIAEGLPMYLNLPEDKRSEMYPKFAQSLIKDNPKMAAFIDPSSPPNLAEIHKLQAGLKSLGYGGSSQPPMQKEGEIDENLVPADEEYRAGGDNPEDINNPNHYVESADSSLFSDNSSEESGDDEEGIPKLPSGFRWADPNNKNLGIEPIPGSNADWKRKREEEKDSKKEDKESEPYEIEKGYRMVDPKRPDLGVEPIPGGSKDKMDMSSASKLATLKYGIRAAEKARSILFLPDGKINRRAVFESDIPLVPGDRGMPYSEGRRARALMELGLQSQLRAETGATANEQEIERLMDRFAPNAWDNDRTARDKFEAFESVLKQSKRYFDPQGRLDHDRFESDFAEIRKRSWMRDAKAINPDASDEEIEEAWNAKINRGKK